MYELVGKGSHPIENLQFLARIVTYCIYLILCDFNECFKIIGFFKIPSVSCLDKNRKILEDSIGGDRKIISYSGSTLNAYSLLSQKWWVPP